MSNQASTSSNTSGGNSSSNRCQRDDRFRCPQCPFIGCNKYSVLNHLRHHRARSSFQCSLCTFSVSRQCTMVRHINRVHPEEADQYAAEKVTKELRPISSNPADFEVPILIPTESPQLETTDSSNERGVHVIEDQELDDDEVIVIEPDPENPRCLSCGEEQSNQSTMIRCDDCDSFFHASCVNFNIDQQLNDKKQSICPLCNHKGSPMSHMAKLVQAIASFDQIYQGADEAEEIGEKASRVNKSTSILPMIPSKRMEDTFIKHCLIRLSQLCGLDSMEETEEMKCHKELDLLIKDITACRSDIVQVTKEFEAETHITLRNRATQAEIHRKRMEELKIAEQSLSTELTSLMEQRKRIQQEEEEKTELKIKAYQELFLLKYSSCCKVKQEASSGPLSSPPLGDNNAERIQKKETFILNLKQKLEEFGKDRKGLNERIRTVETKKEENNKNLVELQKDLENFRALSDSSSNPMAAKIKGLKNKVRKRLIRFAYLEKHLVLLHSKHVIDDILKKKKEWLESYDCDDDDDDEDEDEDEA